MTLGRGQGRETAEMERSREREKEDRALERLPPQSGIQPCLT